MTEHREYLKTVLTNFAELIANTTEAFSSVIFLADHKKTTLEPAGYHSLSREFIADVKIPWGGGFVGWAAKNAQTLSVSPFNQNSTNLFYYSADQGLKSFVAMPIHSAYNTDEIIGVIACDSKRSYAFPKLCEKILFGFSEQISLIVSHSRRTELLSTVRQHDSNVSMKDCFLKSVRSAETEEALFEMLTQIPQDVLDHEALLIVTTAQGGIGAGKIYSAQNLGQNSAEPNTTHAGHRLLDLVCKYKKVICSDRVVQVPPSFDRERGAFLSVPFSVLGQEAGSLNLLGRDGRSFSAAQIATLEDVAKAIGEKLELLRLRERCSELDEFDTMLSPAMFAIKAEDLIEQAHGSKRMLTLMRIYINNLSEFEQLFGFKELHKLGKAFSRLIEQAKGSSALACQVQGHHILVLLDRLESKRFEIRLRSLLKKLGKAESTQSSASGFLYADAKIGEVAEKNLEILSAQFPSNGTSIDSLVEYSLPSHLLSEASVVGIR